MEDRLDISDAAKDRLRTDTLSATTALQEFRNQRKKDAEEQEAAMLRKYQERQREKESKTWPKNYQ